MLMKMPTRSGDYAIIVRYASVGIGVDTDKCRVAIVDEQQRLNRHRAILSTLHDTLLSPDGAMTAAMHPPPHGLAGGDCGAKRCGPCSDVFGPHGGLYRASLSHEE